MWGNVSSLTTGSQLALHVSVPHGLVWHHFLSSVCLFVITINVQASVHSFIDPWESSGFTDATSPLYSSH